MREIKFRAWDKEDKEMIDDYGNTTLVECYGWTGEYYIPMQFTGLKDAKGVDIYEGDILENKEGIRGTVVFLNGSFCLNSKGYYVLNSGYLKNKKVIGNIYENNSSKS